MLFSIQHMDFIKSTSLPEYQIESKATLLNSLSILSGLNRALLPETTLLFSEGPSEVEELHILRTEKISKT